MKLPFTLMLGAVASLCFVSASQVAYEGFNYGGANNADFASLNPSGGAGWSASGKSQWTTGTTGQSSSYLGIGLNYDSPTGTDIAGLGGALRLNDNSSGAVSVGRIFRLQFRLCRLVVPAQFG